jgi:spermidine synthase
VPWRLGESSLFTREHFDGARRALAPGGLFCQWLPLYQLTAEELAIVAATFADAFPGAGAWRGGFVAEYPVLGLVGGEAGAPLDVAAIDQRVRELAPMLARDVPYWSHPAGLWLSYVGELDASSAPLAGARRNTLDWPWLELAGARAAHAGARGGGVSGEPLARFLVGLRLAAAPPELDAQHLRWRDLGARLFDAACLDLAGDAEGARRAAFDALGELPPEIRASVLGPARDDPSAVRRVR